MVNNGIPADGGNRSNTAYIGSYQESLANQTIHARQMRRAAQQADVAVQDGYIQGRDVGYEEGWTDAVNEANRRMTAQLAFTRQHVEDKGRLKAELEAQLRATNALEFRARALEAENQHLRQENGLLRKADTSLRELVSSLRSANEKLRQQITTLDANFKQRTQEYADQLWQYNRAKVFVSAAGEVLEELTRGDMPQAQRARELFAERYAQEVDKGLKQGTIKMAPDVDPVFSKSLPKTRQCISDLLAVAQADRGGSRLAPL